MEFLINFSPNKEYFAISIIINYSIFALTWAIDAHFHNKYLNEEKYQGELKTHLLILIPSILMEISLILMYWFPIESLPFFLACYLTRTIQEFIDEHHWHVNRCTLTESILHLVMWISVHAKTFITFIWGFFYQYQGITELPFWMYSLFFLVIGATIIITAYDLRPRKIH
jgi:hypothetical protein